MAQFDNTWTLYELVFAALQGEESFFRPPAHGLRHPMQFYYGHTAVFYINKFVVAGLLDKPIEPQFESQFEIGVDEMRWDDMSLGDAIWPRVSEVLEYRREVYNRVKTVIDLHFDSTPRKVQIQDPLWSLFMAIEHDHIHAETSSMLIRELPLDLVQNPEFFPQVFKRTGDLTTFPQNQLIDVKPEKPAIKLGKNRDYPSFGWDNEYGVAEMQVKPFKAARDLVTNGEFLEFVKANGYIQQQHWSQDGWAWRRFRNQLHPQFWVRDGPSGSHLYKLRNMFQVDELDLSLPAIVNFHEARAFCNWKAERDGLSGLRLTTEAEHQSILDEELRMENVSPDTDPALLYGGKDLEHKCSINAALAYGSERPVDMARPNKQGFRDASGNVWHWCEDQMKPFEGFETHPYYVDFTEPCFDGKHQIIQGGSFISMGDNGVNAHCRYHFRPHFHQQAGFRYVLPSQRESYPGEAGGVRLLRSNVHAHDTESDDDATEDKPKQQTQADYESEKLINQYLTLHFASHQMGEKSLGIPLPEYALDFPRRCGRLLFDTFTSKSPLKPSKVLDLGCAVGGSSFHLASLGFDKVVGVDLSRGFIDAAKEIQEHGQKMNTETGVMVTLNTKELSRRHHTEFLEGDACDLPLSDERFQDLDAMLCANLLCRLPDPNKCLEQLPSMVKKGGLVMFASPFSWMTSFTPSNKWLSGTVGSSEKELVEVMEKLGFGLVAESNLPALIQDHPRKFQYIVSHVALFTKL